MGKGKNVFGMGIVLLIWVLLLSLSSLVALLTDYWWFDSLGFSKIFTISLQAKLCLFVVSLVAFLVFALINLGISTKLNKSKVPFKIKFLVALVLSFFVGLATYPKWFTVLQYLNQIPFGLEDPIFMKDAAFYVFSLPFILMVWKFAMACVVLSGALVLVDYLQSFIVDLFSQRRTYQPGEIPSYNVNFKSVFANLKRTALVHLGVLGSFFFLLLSVKHYLDRFSIMYSEKGIVVGAGYTDVVAYLPIIKILMILSLVVVVLFYVWIFYFSKQKKLRKRHVLAAFVILYAIVFFIGPTFITGVFQSLVVSPNEINLEKPYIDNNIEFTKLAYGLDKVEERDFLAEQALTPEILNEADETLDNIRILDWRPLTQTYKQTQEIRLYYDLSSIDLDRYVINGKPTAVMISPRELDQTQIADNAKTWVNLHMIYTHGFGVVVSPVNSVTKEGLPNYLIKDIPPIYNVDEPKLIIDKPQIYFGQQDNDFVLVNTNTAEFDYPKGNTNEYISYDGKDGIVLNSFFKKLMVALKFADIKILLSSDVTPESKILFDRQIQTRIAKLTPFLLLDNDPYVVINEGRLFWIQDAYTVTGSFPYSQKFGPINYMRNSVKIVVDAYDGTVVYYVVDTTDPLIRTYANIFPQQFKAYELMSEGLKEHTRYPEDLFNVQAQIYSTYHMEDATVFYNKEDAWQTPTEIYGTGQQMPVEPYYIIMKLPGETEEEFVLMTSFTPIRKNNMIAWMAARSDGDDYGKLLLYKFPKDKLIYGPLQIEAKIDQDSEISQQLTLWSQQGSRVTRGNLLVIPIKDSLLYVEPLYIQAETGQLPELKRVLVSDGESVVMEETFAEALEVLFGRAKELVVDNEGVTQKKSVDELVAEAQKSYDALIESMGNDWITFGENFDRLGQLLEQLN